jgi:hypothetical protein
MKLMGIGQKDLVYFGRNMYPVRNCTEIVKENRVFSALTSDERGRASVHLDRFVKER